MGKMAHSLMDSRTVSTCPQVVYHLLTGSLLKDYIRKDYTDVPKKTLVLIVAALLYLVNPRDLIPDKYLGIGLIDDAAVMAACIALTKDDLTAYDVWRKAKAASKESESARTEATEAKEVILPNDEVIPE